MAPLSRRPFFSNHCTEGAGIPAMPTDKLAVASSLTVASEGWLVIATGIWAATSPLTA